MRRSWCRSRWLGERVDRTIALLTGWSRAAVRVMVEAGDVFVDGQVASRSAKLEAGSTLEWRGEPAAVPLPGPEPEIAVTVVYEDWSEQVTIPKFELAGDAPS